MFDRWIVVEGHAKPGGSTSWCKETDLPKRSTDGTHEYLSSISDPKLTYFSPNEYWESKDAQVNKCVSLLKEPCYLWQVDCDEHWDAHQLDQAERQIRSRRAQCGSVGFHHYVGFHDRGMLVAKGYWGSAYVNRVWDWNGEKFASHEPAVLEGQGKTIHLKQKFKHYAYCFDQDIRMKEIYYGYENLYERWQKLKNIKRFPVHARILFGQKNHISRTRSYIHLEQLQA